MGSRFKVLLSVSAAVVSMAALAAWSPASAQSRQSDGLFVYDAAGNVIASAVQGEAGESAGAIVTVPGVAIDATQFGNATVLTEGGGANAANSDIFGISSDGNGNLSLSFASDDETNSVNFGSFPLTFVENAGGFDATLYLDPALRAAGDTAVFFSDTGVPEPAAWALMLSGFGLAGAALRRRRPALAIA